MKKWLVVLLCGGFVLTGCKTVSVRVTSEDENIRLAVPFALVKQGLKFSDGQIELDDLGGVDQEIDLRKLAKALSEDGDRIRFEIKQDDQTIIAKKVGNVFRINIDEPESDTRVTVNLPMRLMERIAEVGDKGSLSASAMMNCLKNYSGVLLEVDSPDEQVRIALN